MRREGRRGGQRRVLFGNDGRASSSWILESLVQGLMAAEVSSGSVGVVTTPALALLTASGPYDAGIMISASHNPAHDNGVKIFGAEIAAAPSSNNFWSWVDAAFMAMNTWARMGAATGEAKYFEKQWSNFNAAMLLPAEGHGSNDEGKTFVSLSGAALCCRPEARR